MKYTFILLLSFLIIANPLNAQINRSIPEWVNPININSVGTVNKKQIKEGYHYILVDEQYNAIKKHNYFHFASSAITEEALVNVSQIEFSYDPAYEKAYLHDVKIHRGNDIINKTSSLELKELNEENERNNGVLNGRKTLYTNLSDVRKGDIVEYSYSIIGENPIMKNYFNYTLWLSYSVPVGKIHTRVLFPKSTEISILNNNTSVKPVIKVSDVNDYTWEINNPQVTKEESAVPSWYTPYQRVQISNLKNWNEVKSHCKTLLLVGNYNKHGIQKMVDSIVKPKQNIEDKITSIIEFVQTHVRYSGNENGIYSHVPRTPEFVLKNRFGDCKEKSVLLCEMMKLIDVESYPVLVSTTLCNKVKDQNPSINIFNHCISLFTYKGKHLFVDPTISYQRGSFKLRKCPNYELGMVMDNSKDAFEIIPNDIESKSTVAEEFVIEKSGDTKLKVTSKYTGFNADEIRYTFLTNSLYDIQDNYKQFYYKYTEDIDVIDTVTYEDNQETNEFTTNEYYTLNHFWTADDSSKSKTISRDFMPYSLNYKFNYGEENKRNDPLKIVYPLNQHHTIIVKREGGWDVKNELKSENNKFFSYTFSTTVSEDQLNLVYDYSSKTETIEPKDYKSYKAKMDFINYNIVFSAQEKPLVSGIIGFNWILLLTILSGLLVTAIVVVILYKRSSVTAYENRYDSIGSWLVLLGIGISISPLSLLFALYKEYYDEMGLNYLVYFFHEESSYFSPLRGYFTLFVAFINSAMLVFTVFIAVLYFQKKASFRVYFSFFRIFDTLFLIVNVIVIHSIYGDSTDVAERKILSGETSAMISVFIVSCIWVPYVWFSERSRHTFTNVNMPKDSSHDAYIIQQVNSSESEDGIKSENIQ